VQQQLHLHLSYLVHPWRNLFVQGHHMHIDTLASNLPGAHPLQHGPLRDTTALYFIKVAHIELSSNSIHFVMHNTGLHSVHKVTFRAGDAVQSVGTVGVFRLVCCSWARFWNCCADVHDNYLFKVPMKYAMEDIILQYTYPSISLRSRVCRSNVYSSRALSIRKHPRASPSFPHTSLPRLSGSHPASLGLARVVRSTFRMLL
jgi:hypothetical protein